MLSEAHKVVQHTVDGLRATGFIIRQHPMAMGWSVDLTTAPTCTPEEPSVRCRCITQQTACRSWSVCRAESSEARGTLQVMCTAILEPLASSAWPPEAWRTRGWPRQHHLNGRRKFVSEIARKRVKKTGPGGGNYCLKLRRGGLLIRLPLDWP